MPGPMDGMKVVEMGVWIAGPSCGGILADWGADVVKIEPLTGDPFRSLEWLYPGQINPPFELDNRGKRSVAIDITTPGGIEVLHQLLDQADVFVTNFRPGGLERAGLDYETLHARYPSLIYAAVTGYGLTGPDRDRAAYDVGAFWSRAGIAAALTPEGGELPYQRGGMGDHMTGMAAAGGVSAALFHREKTGEGQLVLTSLLRLGTYMLGWDQNVTARIGTDTEGTPRSGPPNPLINAYACQGGDRLWMLGLEGERHWPDVIRALRRPEWARDPRFSTIELRRDNCAELTAAIDEVMATRSRDEWGTIFDAEDVWWAPVQSTGDLRNDEQAHAIGCWTDVPLPEGGTAEMVATPVDFSATPWEVRDPVPELGQHTELVLMELGVDWDHIEQLKQDRVIH
ncbi:MAG: CoA transferase [Actinomycetia bacterium]|nr:CoA transferase [Actinomycetes bacterium]